MRTIDFAVLYLTDYVHLAFSLVLAYGFGLAANLKRRVHAELWLATSCFRATGRVAFVRSFDTVTTFVRSFPIVCCYLAVGLLVGSVFLDRAADPSFSGWWGNVAWGHVGFLYFGIVTITFTMGALYLTFIYFLLWKIASTTPRHLFIRPFHRDGHSGLSRFGRLINSVTVQALIGCSLFLIAYISEYLRLFDRQIVWTMFAIGVIVLTLLPLVTVAVLSYYSRRRKLELVSSLLATQFSPSGRPWSQIPPKEKVAQYVQPKGVSITAETSDYLVSYAEKRASLMGISAFPFPRLNLILIAIWSVAQAIVGSDAIFGFLFTPEDPDLWVLDMIKAIGHRLQ